MRYYQLIMEAKVGRNLQHLEDLVFVDGSDGALRALDILERFSSDVDDVSIKWDGCIHPESILYTDNGEETIQDLINRHNQNEFVMVLAHDFDSDNDLMVGVEMASSGTGSKEWVTIHLENNRSITLTADHKVHTTNRGWVEASDLTGTDDISELQNELPKK